MGEKRTLRNGPDILLIDEDPHDRALAATVLARELPRANIHEIEDATSFARAMRTGGFEIVVTEWSLNWTDGLAVLEAVLGSWPSVPVLFFSRVDDRSKAVQALKAGVWDYLVKSSKGYLDLPGAVSDALYRAKAHQRRARSETRLQALLDRSRIGVFRSSLDRRLLEANPTFLRLLGVETLEHAQKIELPELYFSTEGPTELLRRLDENAELHEREVELRRADGSTVQVKLTEILLLDAEGEMVIDGLVEDVSEVQRSQESLKRRIDELERSNADLREFASVASHELQEPLRMVERYTRMLEEEYRGKLDADAGEYLTFARDGATRMQALIEDLLAFSKVSSQAQAFQVCDCNTLVERAMRNLQEAIEESGADIERETLPTVLGDASQLVQVFQNLLANAIKFRGDQTPEIRISVRRRQNEWLISVHDNGIGIDPEQEERIFAIFSRLHPEYPGTGIGLAICKRIVERHGGRIWVESERGRGSAFCLTFPFDQGLQTLQTHSSSQAWRER